MDTNRCGNCLCYLPEVEPDGSRNGMGFCTSLATKQTGREFESPVGMVSTVGPACSLFSPEREDARVTQLLTPPALPAGLEIERAIEVQAGRCHRQQDTMAAGLREKYTPLNRDQQRICEIQIKGVLGNPAFHGKIILTFGGSNNTSLLAWAVRQYPNGGEIRV